MPVDCGWRCGEFRWERHPGRLAVPADSDLSDPTIACSYCGSMTPEAMMAAMRAGAEIGPTDKSYKIYVDGDDRHGKFYMNHITDPAMAKEFWDAYVAKTMKVGYPGHFYAKIWLPGLAKPVSLT